MEYLKQFRSHIVNNDLPIVAGLWQEYCLSDEVDVEEFILILKEIKGSPLVDSFGCYVEQGLMLWESLPESLDKHTVLKLIFDIQTTNDSELGDLAYNYLEKRYGADKHFQHKIKLIGLRDRVSFQSAISNYELLSHMEIGNFFIHTGGWGVGEVVDVSMLREQITLEFDYVAGNKELSFSNAFKTLVPIPKEHFLAQRFGNPEEFEVFAKEKPIEMMRMLLKDLGPRTAAEIKDELADLVIPEKDWPKWWQATRTKLKKDTFIETPESLKDPFRLRREEVSHEERLQKTLKTKPDANTLIEIVYSFIRDFPAALKNEPFRDTLKKQLMEVLSQEEITDSQEVQLLFILQDLEHERAKNLGAVVSGYADVEKVVNEIHVLAYRKRLLIEVKKVRSDWEAVFASLLLLADQNTLRDYIIDELLSSGKEALVLSKLEELIEHPNRAPQAFLWYFQKIMVSDKYPMSNQEGMDRFLEAFFILLHILEPQIKMRDFVKKMLAFFSLGRYANIRRIFQGASLEVVKEILLLCTKCQTLTDHDIKILYSLAEVVHPSIAALKKGLEDDVVEIIWTTQEGYTKIAKRIEKIASVDILENAKEIEIARSHGDLRENSEYKFAQERRARLQSELKFLSSQIKQMRILTKQDIDLSEVNVGTVVLLEGESGEKAKYTLLGPWDADPENNILSFQSQLAKSMIGLTIGKTCTIQGKDWKVAEIASAI